MQNLTLNSLWLAGYRRALLLGGALGLLLGTLAPEPRLQAAGIDIDRLKELKAQNSPTYKGLAKAVTEALIFSTAKPVQRSKLPGVFRFYLETGAAATDIKDGDIAFVSKVDANNDRFAPDGYESVFGKVGLGLPFGFIAEVGTSYLFSEHTAAAMFGNLALQVFDFDRMVVTDMVPTLALGANLHWNYIGPSLVNAGLTGLIGAYHRYWLAQINYILQVNYAHLLAGQLNHSEIFIRHGISSYWPIFEGLYLLTEVYYEPVQVGLMAGYQF